MTPRGRRIYIFFLGREPPDELRQYSVCSQLGHLLARFLYLPLPTPPPSALTLLGLDLPKSFLTSPTYLAFTIYHASRSQNLFITTDNIEHSIVPIAKAARRRLDFLSSRAGRQPQCVRGFDSLEQDSLERVSEPLSVTAVRSRSASANSVSQTIFVQGGDHFMTTSEPPAR